MSDNHPPARNYQLITTLILFFLILLWSDAATSTEVNTSASARQIGTHDDVAISAIQTSLAALQMGSALAAKLPYIAPIAGLLLRALTMRDARLTHISFRQSLF